METVSIVAIIFAVAVILLGLGLHFWSVSARGRAHFHATTVIAWLLIALFPVLILFSFFPESEVHGTIFGVSAGGAVALFLVIWYYGPKGTAAGRSLDALEHTIAELQREKHELTDQIQGAQPGKAKPLRHAIHTYSIEGAPGKSLAVITGDLTDVRECDCWVNSENTYMQMSRVFEKSISAVIRYHGARRDAAGNVVDDLIADELRDALKGAKVVLPASVYLTSGGVLEGSHGVKVIAHVASATGQVGVGWMPIDNIHHCVTAVLDAVDASDERAGVHSILFPLMGTGQAAGRSKRDDLVWAQMAEAVDFLASHAQSNVNRVCFLAWTDDDFDVCNRAVELLPIVHEDPV